jgi:hypothetical protein
LFLLYRAYQSEFQDQQQYASLVHSYYVNCYKFLRKTRIRVGKNKEKKVHAKARRRKEKRIIFTTNRH